MQERGLATLSNNNGFTCFSYGGHVIRFRTSPYSPYLERYTGVKEWDNGYLVTTAKYSTLTAEEEEYIDLVPVLENLYFDPQEFLKPIRKVRIAETSLSVCTSTPATTG